MSHIETWLITEIGGTLKGGREIRFEVVPLAETAQGLELDLENMGRRFEIIGRKFGTGDLMMRTLMFRTESLEDVKAT